MKRVRKRPKGPDSECPAPLETPTGELDDRLIESYRLVAQGTPDWECWRNPEGRCVYVSPSCERITGYRSEQFLSDPGLHLQLVHPDDRERVASHTCGSGESGETRPLEYRIRRSDGEIRWISHICHPIRNATGANVGRRTLQRDVTAKKMLEVALSGQEVLFRELAENLREVLWIVSPDWNQVHFVSSAYAEIWGRSCEELYAKPTSWRDAILEEDRPGVNSAIERFRRDNLADFSPPEFRIRRPDGSIRWIRARGFGVRDDDGAMQRVVGVAEDVTEQKQAGEALLRGQREYQALAENLPALVYRIHLRDRSRMQFYNELLEPMTGYRGEELADGEVCSLIPLIIAEDRPKIRRTVLDAIAAGRPFELNYRLKRKDGAVRHMSEKGRPVRDEEDRPLYIDGLIFDVTDRALQEERLREREAQLRAFFEAGAVYMSIVALTQGDLVFSRPNETMASAFGMTAAQLRGKRCREVGIPDATVDEWLTLFTQCRDEGRPSAFEYVLGSGDRRRWFQGTISSIAESASPPLCALASVEITERRTAEQAFRRSESRFREVLETSLDASYRRDLKTDQYDYMSPVIRQIGGYSPEEMAALDTEGTLDLVHPEDRQRVHRELEQTLTQDSGFIEYRFRHKDGEYRWLGDKIHVVRNERGEPLYRVGVVRDITHRKQVEEALLEAKRELEERVRQRTSELEARADQLARLASELTLVEQRERRRLAQILHDHLQQLLVGAKFGLDVLSRRVQAKHQPTVEQVEKLLNEAINTARSLTADLSPPILHEAGIDAALQWLIRRMQDKHGLTVELETDGTKWSGREELRILVFQSVREALLNVVKHAQVSRARVSLSCREGSLRIDISDSGVGFDTRTLTEDEGMMRSGYGLASIRERLRLLGGTLEIDSAPHEGSRLSLTVPIGAPAASRERQGTHADRADTRGEDGAESSRQKGNGKSIRILLVDDHVVMRQGLSMLLSEESDLEIIGEASDGREAVKYARDLRPDVILMDFSMPRMNGVEATRIIHGELPDVRIIGLSMYEETDRAAAMREAGAIAYLSKSGRSDTLLETIRNPGA